MDPAHRVCTGRHEDTVGKDNVEYQLVWEDFCKRTRGFHVVQVREDYRGADAQCGGNCGPVLLAAADHEDKVRGLGSELRAKLCIRQC